MNSLTMTDLTLSHERKGTLDDHNQAWSHKIYKEHWAEWIAAYFALKTAAQNEMSVVNVI